MGTPKVGVTLKVSPGAWTAGVKLAVRWAVNGRVVSGATNSTFVPRGSDAGGHVTVSITGTKAGYAPLTTTSAGSRNVAKGTLVSSAPKIAGTAKAGKTLTVKMGSWSRGTVLAYRWYVNGHEVSRTSTYKVAASAKGKTVSVRVIGKMTGYTDVVRTSGGVKVHE